MTITPTTVADKVLYDAQSGLLPYVNLKMGGDYAKWQVKNYSFGTDSTTGYRVRDGRTVVEGTHQTKTESLIIGAILQETAITDEVILAARTIRDNLVTYINEWSECRCPYLMQPVTEFDHSISHETLQGIPATTVKSFWTIVLVRFSITFKG